jgi:hypothetical protein
MNGTKQIKDKSKAQKRKPNPNSALATQHPKKRPQTVAALKRQQYQHGEESPRWVQSVAQLRSLLQERWRQTESTPAPPGDGETRRPGDVPISAVGRKRQRRGATQGGRVMVRGDHGTGKGNGPTLGRAPAGPNVVDLINAKGEVVGHVQRHASRGTFNQVSMPLAIGEKISGFGVHEIEEMKGGARTLTVAGLEFLDTVETGADPVVMGDCLPRGIYPINPTSIGGRLGLAAEQFQNFQVEYLAVHYVPVKGLQTDGAIALAFYPDPTVRLDTVGRKEFALLTTAAAFETFPAWEPDGLVVPVDRANVYFDDEEGDARFSVQGILRLVAASSLASGLDLGNLFLEYKFRFENPLLSAQVVSVPNVYITIDGPPSISSTLNNGRAFMAGQTSTGTNITNLLTIPVVAGDLALSDITRYVLVGAVSDSVGSGWLGGVDGRVRAAIDAPTTGKNLTGGRGIAARVFRNGTASTQNYLMTFYESYAAALSAEAPLQWTIAPYDYAAVFSDEQLVYTNSTVAGTPATSPVAFDFRAIPLTEVSS